MSTDNIPTCCPEQQRIWQVPIPVQWSNQRMNTILKFKHVDTKRADAQPQDRSSPAPDSPDIKIACFAWSMIIDEKACKHQPE